MLPRHDGEIKLYNIPDSDQVDIYNFNGLVVLYLSTTTSYIPLYVACSL